MLNLTEREKLALTLIATLLALGLAARWFL